MKQQKIISEKLPTIYPEGVYREYNAVEQFVRFLFDLQTPRKKFPSNRAKILRALFLKKDISFLQEMQTELEHIQKILCTHQSILSEIANSYVLALLPFLEPLPHTVTVSVPVDGILQSHQYSVERIPLSPLSLGSPLTAYGLTSPNAPPLLLFMGTPPHTVSGSFLSIWTDFVPGFAIGELAFRLFAKRRIQAFLEKIQKPVQVYGLSLGAAFALHTAVHFPKNIARVRVWGAPALSRRTLTQLTVDLDVVVYWRKKDIVPLIGSAFHPTWKIMLVEDRPQNFLVTHIRGVVAEHPVTISEIDPKKYKNLLRTCLTFLHAIVAIPIFIVFSSVIICRAILRRIFSLFH